MGMAHSRRARRCRGLGGCYGPLKRSSYSSSRTLTSSGLGQGTCFRWSMWRREFWTMWSLFLPLGFSLWGPRLIWYRLSGWILGKILVFWPFFFLIVWYVVSGYAFWSRFTSAELRGENWQIPLPPFGQGWWVVKLRDKNISFSCSISIFRCITLWNFQIMLVTFR